MFEPRNGLRRLTRTYKNLTRAHKYSIGGVAAVSAAAVTFSLVPGNASAESAPTSLDRAPVAFASQTKVVRASLDLQQTHADQSAKDKAAAKAKAEAKAQAKADAKAKAEAAAKAKADRAKAAKAVEVKRQAEAALKAKAKAAAAKKHAKHYPNNLNGWINEALSIMRAHGIPGTYHGLHRNIIRESSGNPRAINLWDINARNGIPSKGLLQTIQPTFDAYHVKGTSHDVYNPVANIVAAANYAADRYGSIDNVNGPY